MVKYKNQMNSVLAIVVEGTIFKGFTVTHKSIG